MIEQYIKTFDMLSIIATDMQGTIVYFNKGAEKIFGYDSQEIEGKRSISILYPANDQKARQTLDAARMLVFLKKESVTCEVPEVTHDGRQIWMRLNLMPRIDDTGNIVGILGVGEDITVQRKNEDHLRKSNESYRLLLQLIPDIVYIIDPQGNFSFISESIKVLGYTPAELVGRHFKVIIHPDDYPRVSKECVLPQYKGMTTGDAHAPKLFDERRSGKRMTTNLEVRLVSNAGSSSADSFVGIISAVNASGHYSFDGEQREFLGTIGVIRDITERKHAEEEYDKLQEQLNQAQKMEAIGRLAGGVAHDFNNMLAGILGYAEVIKRRNMRIDNTPVDADLERFVDVIIKAAERAGTMTEKLIAFSRQGKYQVIPVNLHDTIAEVQGLIEHAIDRRIEICRQFNATNPVVVGDPTQLHNVVLNLAMNARDAMPHGGVLTFITNEVDVDRKFVESLSFHMLPGHYVLLQVADNGIGMDEQTKLRLFEPFFTTKALGEGVGLGLSSVYGTVKGHHGAVLVDSMVGKGTTVSIYLPSNSDVERDTVTTQLPVEQGAVRILVVDDEEIVRTILQQVLRDLGYAVTLCCNGVEALTVYRQSNGNFDLVILDMNMPIMNGMECLTEMRRIRNNVKVIILTGYNFQTAIHKHGGSGIAGYLQKPFKLSVIAEEIKKVLATE